MRDHCQRWQWLSFSKEVTVEARTTRWGFVRFWAKDQAIGNKIINARSETLADRPLSKTFFPRAAASYRRTAFMSKTKQPIH